MGNLADVSHKGSTGGVFPVGQGALSVFNDVTFDDPSRAREFYHSFNYTMSHQGITIDIPCQEASTTPITRKVLNKFNVKNDGWSLMEQEFDCQCPE